MITSDYISLTLIEILADYLEEYPLVLFPIPQEFWFYCLVPRIFFLFFIYQYWPIDLPNPFQVSMPIAFVHITILFSVFIN